MDIGIIGGTDGPTKIYVSSNINTYTNVAIIILCIAILGVIIWRVSKRKG